MISIALLLYKPIILGFEFVLLILKRLAKMWFDELNFVVVLSLPQIVAYYNF